MRPYVIGNPDCVLGFSLAGISGKIVHTADELSSILEAALQDKTIGMIIISADVASLSRERVDQLEISSISPLIIEVPGQVEGAGAPSLMEMVQRSVGISLGGNKGESDR
ncbi:MAG: V-type ATP synthase subunit F [Chloroflexi bacterium]|nr:V-type ATP synthase subunit F [Chloroflexota bacterium]